jgi:hypothetical protein
MALNRKLIAIIGRVNPAIYDVIFPRGPIRVGVEDVVSRVALNPQPLPPVARMTKAAFDPQPEPPGVALGAQVAYELVRAAGMAKAFGLQLQLVTEDICPPPKPWPLPWPFPFPWPQPWPDPHPWRRGEWNEELEAGYALGLGAVLEATEESWQGLESAGFFEQLHESALNLAAERGIA